MIDSMFNQHAKWLDISKNHVKWRARVASENILLSSTVWRQDHNGFSHQDRLHRPGHQQERQRDARLFAARAPTRCSRSPTIACARPTTSTSSSATNRSTLQFTTIDEAIVHCTKGFGIWARASNDPGPSPTS